MAERRGIVTESGPLTEMTEPCYRSLVYDVAGRRRFAPLWFPPGYDESRRWPLIVALHGYGERGDQGEHLQQGLAGALAAFPGRFASIVLFPQCPTDRVWVKVDEPWAEGYEAAEDHLDAALDDALEHLPVERDRIVLTGLSMGGFATFVWGAKRAERFCGFLPICGGGIAALAPRFGRRPCWVFHGDADDVVPVAKSRAMVRAISAAGGCVRYSELEGVGHDSWDPVYADPRVAKFLLEPGLPFAAGATDGGEEA
jgi:predicted peptidase